MKEANCEGVFGAGIHKVSLKPGLANQFGGDVDCTAVDHGVVCL